MTRWLTVLVTASLFACGPRGPRVDAADSAGTASPALVRLAPDTISLGQQAVPTLTLTGSGFTPGGTVGFADGSNTVHVGRARIERVPADSLGTTIRFDLALSYSDSTSPGRPAVFTPGDYPVTVVTARGTSNTLTLTMIR